MHGSSPRSDDRIVLVTGATSGIGLATARLFAERGHQVLGTSRDPDRIPDQVRIPGVRYLALDQADPASVADCAKSAGPVQILINNAGQSQGGALEDLPPEMLEWLFQVNVLGPVALTRALLPELRRTGGRILFLGSLMAEFPVPFQSSYAASKLALRGFVTALRTEIRPFGVEACVVEPGYYRSAIDRHRSWHSTLDSPYQGQLDRVSAAVRAQHHQAGDPNDVAERMWRLVHSSRSLPVVSMVGSHGGRLRFARRFMPDRLAERMTASRYGLLA